MSRQRNEPRKLPMKVPMSPSHLEAYCCLCSEYISYGYNRKNLWHKCVEGKTRICTLVEQVLQLNITRSAHTEFICSSCFSKVKSLNTKIQSIREEIDTYVEKIGWHGAAMKCKQQVKQGIRERLTATEPPIKQPGHREAADSLVDQSIGENNFPPSLPELPPGDGHQQSALMSAPWMTSLLTVLELGSSQPAQSDSPTTGSTPAGNRRSIIEALGRSIPAGSGRSTPKASGRSTTRGSRRSVVADNKGPSPEGLCRSTPEVLRRSTPDALGRSTPEASGRSTPGGFQRSTPGDSGRSILAGTKRSSSRASGKLTPEVLRRSTPEALGRSTPVALGRSSPVALERSSPEVSGRSSPEASGRSSPNASGGSTPEASGRSSPKALRGSTPDVSGRSSPPANGRSAVLTEHDYGESTSLSPHTRDGSTHDEHQVWDTATGDIKVSAYWDPDQHSYCRTSESHNDVRIVLEIQAGDASKNTREDFVVKDGLAPMGGDYGDCTEEMCGMYDWDNNTELQTELGRAIKIEQSDPQCVEVRDCPSTKKVPCGPQYVVPEVHRVYTVKDDDGSSRYVDVLLPEDNGGNVDVTPFTAARRRRGKRLWKCNLCSLVCKSRHTFIIHERVHTGEKPFLCGTCGRAFAQASYLKTHMRVHTGERPFACRTCEKAYRSTYERTIHERTHRGERPYLCATCGKAFVCNTNLRQHETTHVAVKRHVCPTCGKAFVSHSVLTQHRKIHSGLRPWSCTVCGRAFVTRWHLTRHERSLHPRDPGDAASYITVSTP